MGRGSGVKAGSAALFAALLAVLLLCGAWASGAPSPPRQYVNLPPAGSVAADGQISTIANHGNRVFVRGSFHHIGRFSGSSLSLDAATGQRIAGAPLTDGQVSDAVADGNGGWYIAGSFSFVNGIVQPAVAHINPDGTLDESFAPDLELSAYKDADALALVGDTLYVGGELYSRHAGDSNLVAYDAATGEPAHSVLPIEARVTELAYAPAGPGHTERLVVGTSGYNGSPTIQAIDPATGSAVPGFSPQGGGAVRALAIDGNNLYVGGRALVALDLGTGARIPSFDPASYDLFGEVPNGGLVHSLLVANGRLYAGGNFNFLGGKRGPVVSLDPSTGKADSEFSTSLRARHPGGSRDSGAFDLAMVSGRLWVGGSFEEFDSPGDPRALLALDPQGGESLGPEPVRLNAQVNALATAGGHLYAGGWFFLVNPHDASGLASLNAETLAVTDEVSRLPRGSHRRYAGTTMLPGRDRLLFAETNFGGYSKPPFDPWNETFSRVGAIDTSSGEDLRNRYALGAVHNLSGITIGGSRVYVAQRVQGDADFPRNRISVRSLRTGEEVDSFALPLRGYVTKLDFGGGALYAGGSFRRFRPDGTPAHLAVIKVDPSDGRLLSNFDPHVNGPVYDIEVDNGSVYAIGLFSKAGPKLRKTSGEVKRNPLERRGLDAAAVSDGSPSREFDPRGSWQGDLTRLTGIGDCLLAASPGYYSYYSSRTLLSQQTGGSCPEARRLDFDQATAALGRVAYTGTGDSTSHDNLSYVALAPSP